MSTLDGRLAVVALRAVVSELEGDPAGAAEALRRLLGGAAPAAALAAPKRERPAKPDPEVTELIDRLVEQHGSQRAVARAAGVDFKQVNTWAKGRARPTLDNLRRLRAALVDDEDQGEEPEEPEDDQGEVDDQEHDDRPEPVRLVGALVDRFGDVEAAAAATGLGLARLQRWSDGGPCSPRALGRLREAANAPPGRNDARRREEATSAGADEAPAGEADAPPASRRTG